MKMDYNLSINSTKQLSDLIFCHVLIVVQNSVSTTLNHVEPVNLINLKLVWFFIHFSSPIYRVNSVQQHSLIAWKHTLQDECQFSRILVVLTFTPNEDAATNIKFLVKYRNHITVFYLATPSHVICHKKHDNKCNF